MDENILIPDFTAPMRSSRMIRQLAAASVVVTAAACADGLTSPVVVAAGPAVTADRDAYVLTGVAQDGFQHFVFNGVATFHNITNKTVYLPRACPLAGATVSLERTDRSSIALDVDSPCIYLVGLDPADATPIVVAPGDSLAQAFSCWAILPPPVSEAQIAAMIGSARLTFDVSASRKAPLAVPALDSAMRRSAPIVIVAQ